MHDWMHGVFSGGAFNHTVFMWLRDVAQHLNRIWSNLGDYVKQWHWPRATRFDSERADVFSPSRVKSHKSAEIFKCPASEGLSLLPVMAVYVSMVVMRTALCPEACKALLALADVVDLLKAVPLGITSSADLAASISAFLTACERANWREEMTPKFHWLIHFPHHLDRFGQTPACFVHERKHKQVKRFANEICDTRQYSKSVLSDIISWQLFDVGKPDACSMGVALLDAHVAPKNIAEVVRSQFDGANHDIEVLTSTRVRLQCSAVVSTQDVVMIRSMTPGHVLAEL